MERQRRWEEEGAPSLRFPRAEPGVDRSEEAGSRGRGELSRHFAGNVCPLRHIRRPGVFDRYAFPFTGGGGGFYLQSWASGTRTDAPGPVLPTRSRTGRAKEFIKFCRDDDVHVICLERMLPWGTAAGSHPSMQDTGRKTRDFASEVVPRLGLSGLGLSLQMCKEAWPGSGMDCSAGPQGTES